MSYDPGHGQQSGNPPSPYAPDPSPVPDVSHPIGSYPPAPPPAAPPVPPPYQPAPPPYQPAAPPLPGPPISGTPASPPFGAAAPYPGMGQMDRGPRPATVTAAVALTFAGAALAFVGTVLFHLFWRGWMAAEAAGADVETMESVESVAGAMTFLAAGMNLVAAAGAAFCGIMAMRGSNGARVALCVLAGFYTTWKLGCGGFWMLAGIGASEESPAVRDDVPYLYGAVGIDFLLLLLGIAIMVLLLVGSSRRYFRPAGVKGPGGY